MGLAYGDSSMMNFKFEISNFKEDGMIDDWIVDESHAFSGLSTMIAHVLE